MHLATVTPVTSAIQGTPTNQYARGEVMGDMQTFVWGHQSLNKSDERSPPQALGHWTGLGGGWRLSREGGWGHPIAL